MADQLWAPWRLKYIENADKTEGCIFCLFPSEGAEHDEKNLILHRGEHAFIILNAFPYSNGHLMVVPFRHTARLDAFSDAEMLEVMQLQRLAIQLLEETFQPGGFNLGVNMGRVSGAGIAEHLHWHIVPRWSGDTNFMTVFGDVRVIPESLEVVFSRLKTTLDRVLADK